MTPSSMKIMMINSFYYPKGGDTTCLFLLSQALEDRGHRIIPFSMKYPRNAPTPYHTLFPPPVDYDRSSPFARMKSLRLFLSKGIWNPDAARHLQGLLQTLKPDIAHVHHIHRHLTPSLFPVLRRAGIPIVWTLHDYELICPTGHLFRDGHPCRACLHQDIRQALAHRCMEGSFAASLLRTLEKAVHRLLKVEAMVDRFIAPSLFLLDLLREHGVDDTRIRHIPNIIPLSAIPTPYQSEGPVVAGGRLNRLKGMDLLIDAASAFERPVEILGAGPEAESLERRAREKGVRDRIRFRGWLGPNEVLRHLKRASLVVVPSRWEENHPYSVLEAMACARPVVAAAIGGIPEMIADRRTGLLVEPENIPALASAIRGLLDAPEWARSIGRAAHQSLIGRDREGIASHIQLYREVLLEKRRAVGATRGG